MVVIDVVLGAKSRPQASRHLTTTSGDSMLELCRRDLSRRAQEVTLCRP